MIYLNYGTWIEGELTWQEASMGFNAIIFTPSEETKHVLGRDLREIEYRNVLSSRTNYNIVISADELVDSTKLSFIKSFYQADAWAWNTTSDIETLNIVVLEKDGAIPIEFLEGCKDMPEIKFSLIQKEPD